MAPSSKTYRPTRPGDSDEAARKKKREDSTLPWVADALHTALVHGSRDGKLTS